MTINLHRTTQTVATFINTNTSGDNTIIAAVTGQTTRCHRLHLTAAGAVNVQVKVGTTVVDTFQFVGAAPLPIVLDFNEEPYYETAVNQALIINLSGAVLVQGQMNTITSG